MAGACPTSPCLSSAYAQARPTHLPLLVCKVVEVLPGWCCLQHFMRHLLKHLAPAANRIVFPARNAGGMQDEVMCKQPVQAQCAIAHVAAITMQVGSNLLDVACSHQAAGQQHSKAEHQTVWLYELWSTMTCTVSWQLTRWIAPFVIVPGRQGAAGTCCAQPYVSHVELRFGHAVTEHEAQ